MASDRYGSISLRREVARLRKAAPGAEVQAGKIRELNLALMKERDDTDALRRLLHETVRLYDGTRRLRDQKERIVSLSADVGRLRHALQRSEVGKQRLKGRLLRAVETLRSRATAALELRKALGRSLRQKAALRRLLKENARLRRRMKGWGRRIAAQEEELGMLRATRAVLSKALHGRRSEMRARPPSGRPRGQQRGFPGHGRTPRAGLEEQMEGHHPPAEARRCSGCGKPYAAVGAEESGLFEIEVRAHQDCQEFRVWDGGYGKTEAVEHRIV